MSGQVKDCRGSKKEFKKNMDWWNKMVFRFRRVRLADDVGLKSRDQGEGILKLHDDIQSCGYEDIQVMWEMLRRSDSDTTFSNQSPSNSLNGELSCNRPNKGRHK